MTCMDNEAADSINKNMILWQKIAPNVFVKTERLGHFLGFDIAGTTISKKKAQMECYNVALIYNGLYIRPRSSLLTRNVSWIVSKECVAEPKLG